MSQFVTHTRDRGCHRNPRASQLQYQPWPSPECFTPLVSNTPRPHSPPGCVERLLTSSSPSPTPYLLHAPTKFLSRQTCHAATNMSVQQCFRCVFVGIFLHIHMQFESDSGRERWFTSVYRVLSHRLLTPNEQGRSRIRVYPIRFRPKPGIQKHILASTPACIHLLGEWRLSPTFDEEIPQRIRFRLHELTTRRFCALHFRE